MGLAPIELTGEGLNFELLLLSLIKFKAIDFVFMLPNKIDFCADYDKPFANDFFCSINGNKLIFF
jgi:hypothetical protein